MTSTIRPWPPNSSPRSPSHSRKSPSLTEVSAPPVKWPSEKTIARPIATSTPSGERLE